MLTKKKWISVCVVAILVLFCFVALPMDAQAENGTCGENLTWTLSNGTLTISGTGDMYDYTSGDNAPWFSKRSSVTEIKIGRGVTHIGDYAFRNCEITSLTIPGNVKSIGQYAFRTNQSLQHVVLQEGVESVGKYAFAYCSSLATIKLTSSVKLIAERAVFDCPALTDVYYVGTQTQWNAMTIETGNHKFTGVIRTLSTARGTCGDNLNWDLINGSLTISGTGDMYDYDDPHAPWFNYRGSIKKIKIGEDVTSIGDRAFRNCAITEITIPGNIKTIGQYAFRTCDALKTVTLEEGVQIIEANAFTWCDTLETVHMAESVTTIEEKAFFDCTLLKEVYHPSSLQVWEQVSIGSGNDYLLNATYYFTSGTCGEDLTWSIGGNTLTIDGEGVMYDYTDGGAPWYGNRDRIHEIKMGNNVRSIGNYAFQGCAVTSVNNSINTQRIGKNAFLDCYVLPKVGVPSGIQRIEENTFANCSALTEITIPRSVTKIEENAFFNCTLLTQVNYSGAAVMWDKISIGSGNECLQSATVSVPKSGLCGDNVVWILSGNTLTITGAGDMYDYSEENPVPWGFHTNIHKVFVEDGVTSIGAYAFAYRRNMSKVMIGRDVKKVGSKAFYEADGGYYFCGQAPVFVADALEGCDQPIYYLHDWGDTVEQNYGGEPKWRYKELAVYMRDKVVAYNKVLSQNDFIFKYGDLEYTPRDFVAGQYDNTVYGEHSVTVTIDGLPKTFSYIVSDGTNHFPLINISMPPYAYYTGNAVKPVPALTAGTIGLQEYSDYNLTYKNNQNVGTEAVMTVTGKAGFEGYSKDKSFAVVKRNIAEAGMSSGIGDFCGMPITSHPSVSLDSHTELQEGRDYVVQCENNVNVGTGTVRVVGIGGFYGFIEREFKITLDKTYVTLQGAYNGESDGTLSGEIHYQEMILTPGVLNARVDCSRNNVVSYRLYRLEGDTQELVAAKDTGYDSAAMNAFIYDFTSVYESATDKGGEVYVLSYAWVDVLDDVYAGALVLYVPAKVPEASTMYISKAEEDNFRQVYLDAGSEDGVLSDEVWSSSAPGVAQVDGGGVVTLKKPGTATITVRCGGVSASETVTVNALPMKDAVIFACTEQEAFVCYEGQLLIEGTDYTVSVTESDGMRTATVTGCGLFEGTIARQFETKYGEPMGHTHVFAAVCDPSCETCDFVRDSVHTLAAGWKRDAEGHWHVCSLCGEQQDYEAHTFTGPDTCGVCGGLNLPGDMNNDYEVTDADAVYLLRHTLFEDSYPITRNGDFNGDGQVTDADAVYLLRHTLFPDSYPIY